MRPLLWIAPVLLLATTLTAQDTARERSLLIDVTFKGGTAAEYVTVVRRAADAGFNIMVAPEATEVRMPPVTLLQVSPASAVKLLEGRTLDRPGRLIRLSLESIHPRITGERQTFQLHAVVGAATRVAAAHVWTVQSLLDNDYSSEAVLSAVEMALDVLGSATKLDVRFHEDTGLLIATGDEGQIETIDEVIDRLRDAVGERKVAKMMKMEWAAGDEIRAMRNEVAHLEMFIQQLQTKLEEAQREIARREPDGNRAR